MVENTFANVAISTKFRELVRRNTCRFYTCRVNDDVYAAASTVTNGTHVGGFTSATSAFRTLHTRPLTPVRGGGSVSRSI